MKCPNCGFDCPSGMRYCGSCGTRLTFTCAECGFANPLDYRFCGMCGTQLATDVVQPVIEQTFPISSSETEPLFPATPAQLEGERRVVTVVLTDLTDSTNLLEKVGTEGWVELMNRIFHILESEIYRFGGEVSQFRGDGLVAFFGATSAHEDDPERAVLASLSMQRAFNLYVRELARPEEMNLRMRVGVNTGEVIVASGIDRQHWEETAMGMAVAIAARMEAAAEPGTVLVSEHTYRLIESQFVWQPLGEISVKGVSQPIRVYCPQSHITDTEPLSYGSAFPEAMPRIGRETEFHALKQCVEGLFEGRGHIATLTGNKGSGKSFLLSEVRQYFIHRDALLAEAQADAPPKENSPTWVRGRCRSYNHKWPYSMWFDLFRNWLEIRPDESKEANRISLRHHAEALWGENVDEHYPYLATFLGLQLEEPLTEKVRHLDGEGLRQRCFLAVRSWIEAASRMGPLALAFSDLQWADDSSLDLLKYCLPICDSETLLLLLSFRPEPEASISKFHHYLHIEYPHRLTSVNLPPLTEAQSWELINHLIGSETLPKETRHLIIHNAEGNPYYILELIRALIDGGVLTRDSDGGPWQLTRTVTTLDLPDSLHRLLLARIDRLSAQQRLILQIAAVIGSVFWLNMLEALLGESPTLKADLAALQRAQLVQESERFPELGMQYFFKSPLIRETVYDSLLNNQKSIYHLKVAEYLEDLINLDVLGDYDGMVAYHYRGAGNPKKELFYIFLAAEHERKIHANSEALQHYNRAMQLLEILQDMLPSKEQNRSIQTQRFEVLKGRRDVYYQQGDLEAARHDSRALLTLAQQMADDPVWLIDALLAQPELAEGTTRDELPEGLRMAQKALTLSQNLGDQHREMQSLIACANLCLYLNKPEAKDIAEQALDLARRLGDLRAEVGLLIGISGAYGMDDLPRSKEYLETALSRSEKINDKAIEISLLSALGARFERHGDYYRLLTEYEEKRLRISREIGNRLIEGQSLMFCGQIQGLYLGDFGAGLAQQFEALHIWEYTIGKLFPLLRIAQIQTAQGNFTDALATLQTARPIGSTIYNELGRAGLGLVTAIVHNALGRTKNPESHLRQVLESAAQIGQMVADNLVSRQYHMAAACESSAAYLGLAGLLHDEGARLEHKRQALEASQKALDLYQSFGFVQIVECTSEEILFCHSQALTANDRFIEAADYLQRAYREMMRKYELIPVESPFRKTYLENIQLHRDIQTAHARQLINDSSNLTSIPPSAE